MPVYIIILKSFYYYIIAIYKALRVYYKSHGLIVIYSRGYADNNSRACVKYLSTKVFVGVPIAGLNDCNLPGLRMIQSCKVNEDLVTDKNKSTNLDKLLSFESSCLFLPSDAVKLEQQGKAHGTEMKPKELNDLNRFLQKSSFMTWGKDIEQREHEVGILYKHERKWQMEKVQRWAFLSLILLTIIIIDLRFKVGYPLLSYIYDTNTYAEGKPPSPV